jgi:hypothetical protein
MVVVVNKLCRHNPRSISLENRFYCINHSKKVGNKYKWTSICRSTIYCTYDLLFIVQMASNNSSFNMGIILFEVWIGKTVAHRQNGRLTRTNVSTSHGLQMTQCSHIICCKNQTIIYFGKHLQWYTQSIPQHSKIPISWIYGKMDFVTVTLLLNGGYAKLFSKDLQYIIISLHK